MQENVEPINSESIIFPKEILILILSSLNVEMIKKTALVCKLWYKASIQAVKQQIEIKINLKIENKNENQNFLKILFAISKKQEELEQLKKESDKHSETCKISDSSSFLIFKNRLLPPANHNYCDIFFSMQENIAKKTEEIHAFVKTITS